MPEKLNILNIIEIQRIKSILLIEPGLLDVFNSLLKIANKTLNNEKIEEIIDKDSESELSLDFSSDSSDDNIL